MHTRELALIISMSTLYAALSYLPGFPVIGVENARIGIVSGIAPIYGFLLGPWFGFVSCLIGACISRILSGANLFGWLTLPATPLSAFIAGSLTTQNLKATRGWCISASILAALIAAWYSTPTGRALPYFPILHWIALTLILVFRGKLVLIHAKPSKSRIIIYVAIVSFSSTMTTHMYGTLMFIISMHLLLGVQQDLMGILSSLIPIVIVERLAFTAIATILGVPLILVSRRIPFIRAQAVCIEA
jgi:hypothetical protein